MGALDGTFNTPFGTVQKKTALIIGGGAVLILGIVWWRTNQLNAEESPDIYDAEINPATGYPYGSPEDAAALLAQSQYVSPPTGGGGGGSGGYPPGTGFVNNGQWAQAAVEYMTTAGLIEDPAALSAALGAYIAGGPITTGQRTLIEQAIAFQGYPPLAGPSGYPPSINTAPTPPSTTNPPPPTTTIAAPGKPWVISPSPRQITIAWNAVPNAAAYRVAVPSRATYLPWTTNLNVHRGFTIKDLKPGLEIRIQVQARAANGATSAWSPPLTVRLPKY